MSDFNAIAPVFPVRDIDTAVEHYRKLGFEVRHYEGAAPYAFARRGSVQIHLSQFAEHDPATTASTAYVYVDNADALAEEWRSSGADGRFRDPIDTEYGLREGAHVDPEGNLIRFGSPLT
jgi:catechol 2,3-dioxygenase-like lactoylglutathione lyase family enzyme